MNRRRIALLAVVLLALATVAWAMTRPPRVPALKLTATPLVRTLQFSARATTTARVEVGATLTGRVAQVAVSEGAQVRRGDVLVRLETDELRAVLEQMQASERQSAARLAGLRSTGRSGAQAQVAQAEATLAAAQAELRRVEDLVGQGYVSASRLDEARRVVGVALAQRDSARAQAAANADAGSDVAQAQAQLALAQASAEAARARLAQATIVAPTDARVLSRAVEPGQIVQPGRALMALALDGPLQLIAQVDERYLEQLRPGQAAAVLADAFPGRRFAAQVRSIAPLVDAQRGAIEVKLAPAEPAPDFLREDMTLSVEVETARRDKALALPLVALRGDTDGSTGRVFVLDGGRAERREVQLGLRTLESAEVTAGLAEGDTVLIDATLVAGRRVRPDFAAGAAARSRRPGTEDAGTAVMNTMGR